MCSQIKKQALLFACFWIDYKFLFDRGAGGIIYMIPTFLKVKIKMDSPKAVNPTHSKIWKQAFDFLTRRLKMRSNEKHLTHACRGKKF